MVEEKKIPEGWEEIELKNILKVKHGKSQKDVESYNGKFPILGTGGEIGRANSYLYNKPSVLIGRKGTIDSPQYTEYPFWSIDTLFYTEINSNINPKYVYYIFQTIDWRSYNEGSGVPSLNSKIIESINIRMPVKQLEQQAIAIALSNIDNLILSLEKLISKKKLIKQGTMQQLLTGKKRLDGFSEDWEFRCIGDFAEISTGSKNTEDKVDDGKYPFFVRSQKVERINSFAYDEEAILTAGDGVGVGKVFHYINGKFNVHQRVYKISNFKGVYPKFFFEYFKENFYNEVMKYTAKSSVDSVRRDMIDKMLIPVPNVEEQKQISQILSDMNIEIEKLEIKLDKYKNIKRGMMEELLTGKRRLI